LSPEAVLHGEKALLYKAMKQAVGQQLLPLIARSKRQNSEALHPDMSTTYSGSSEDHSSTLVSETERLSEALFYFLMNGRLPWWARQQMGEVMAVYASIPFRNMQQLVKNKPELLTRILNHYQDEQLLHWMSSAIATDAFELLSFLLGIIQLENQSHNLRKSIWHFALVKHYDYPNSRLLLNGIVDFLHRSQPDAAASVYHRLQQNRSVPAMTWSELWGSQLAVIAEKNKRKRQKGLDTTENVKADSEPESHNRVSEVADDTDYENEEKQKTVRSEGIADVHDYQGGALDAKANHGNAANQDGRSSITSGSKAEIGKTLNETFAAIEKQLKADRLALETLGKCVALLDQIHTTATNRQLMEIAADIHAIFKQRFLHLKRVREGLTSQKIDTLKNLIAEVEQQFTLGNISFDYYKEWQSFKEEVSQCYDLNATGQKT
ncbi:MAG: contractile injection system tape measure protein, partial [Bacteroidota bacterium]